MRFASLWLLVLAAGCGGDALNNGGDDGGGGGNPDLAMTAPDLTMSPDLSPVHSGIGDAS